MSVEALIAAVTGGDVDTVRALVSEEPALASARDADGLPVLLLALFHRQRAAADALLEADPELGVLEAAAAGRADRLRELLAADPAAIEERTPEGFTTLGLAAFLGGPEVVRILLEHGADPNLRQQGGFVPLHEAAHSDDVEMAELLLDHGADPALAADDGRDATRIAADDGSDRVAALLAGSPSRQRG
jgi:uncharacterized protein